MIRREFLAGVAGLAMKKSASIDAGWYRRSRRFARLPMARVAYVERGRGPAALFVHGYPLNGFQWRGALERLAARRRCIAPDVMGLGYTEAASGVAITPAAQVEMLGALLDHLRVAAVDLVGNDSGGLVSQLFVATYPQRVRSLLLTNCDVDENNPPPQFQPLIDLAKKSQMVDRFIAPQLKDKEVARSAKGLGGLAFSYPEKLSDETVEMYFRPLVESAARKAQCEEYAVALGTNVLVGIREDLRRWRGPARMVWGMKEELFPVKWAEWLARTLPGSRGVRRVEGANLFFPEEMPDLIAAEALGLWG